MPEPGKKRPHDDDDEPSGSKKSRGDEAGAVHVYQPCVVLPELEKKMNSLVEVLLPTKYLTCDTKQVQLRQLWGTDVYTDDSDLVAVLVHTGHVSKLKTQAKTPLLVSLRVCPGQASYTGSERNGLSSRDWEGKHPGVSIKVERCLQHTSGSMPAPELSLLRPGMSRQIPGSMQPIAPGPGQSFATPPSACIVVFNLSNEPCLKYTLALLADQGSEESRWTSTRLRREVIFLESRHRRFELAQSGSKAGYDKYTLSQVLKPHTMDRRAMEAEGVPLPAKRLKRLHEDLDWEEVVWGPCFVRVRGEEYPVVRVQFMPRTVTA